MLICKIEPILKLLQRGFEKSAILLTHWNMCFTFENADSCLQSGQHYCKEV